jgi:hypothetical protein
MRPWQQVAVWLGMWTAACTGPALDLGASLRDSGEADAGEADAGEADAGHPDAGNHDAGCRSDGDCTSAVYAHCAVDSGVCARCTDDSQCGIARCEIKLNPANNHCELEGEDDTP